MKYTRPVVGLAVMAGFAACSVDYIPPREAPDAGVAEDAGAELVVDAATPDTVPPPPRTRRSRVLYLLMPDRWVDGDAARNRNNLVDAMGCHNPEDPTSFHGGDIAGLVASADYFADLGVGALWMTPVARQVPGCGYHGYWQDPSLPGGADIDGRFGTAADLTNLGSSLHDRDIHLVLDLVLNHTGPDAALVTERPDWFHTRNDCATSVETDWDCALSGLPDFDQDEAPVIDFLVDSSLAWTRLAAADGARVDAAKHMSTRFLGHDWLSAMKEENPDFYAIGEVYSTDLDLLQRYMESGVDSVFNFPIQGALTSTIASNAGLDTLARAVAKEVEQFGIERVLDNVNFVDNHDMERFANLVQARIEGAAAVDSYALGMFALMTLPGIPQLYYGDEIGMLGADDPDNRRDMPTWALTEEGRAKPGNTAGLLSDDPVGLRDLVKSLVTMRNDHPALYEGGYVELRRQSTGQNVYAFLRENADEAVVVVMNNGAAAVSALEIPVPALPAASRLREGATLRELVGRGASERVEVSKNKLTLSIPARGMAAYRVED